MDIKIKTTKVELTQDLRDYVNKKIKMLEKYLGDVVITNCDVELEHAVSRQNQGKTYRVEVNLAVPGEILRVDKTEKTLNKAIDKVKDHLVLMIKKYKEKKVDKKRGKNN
ncbi:MAG: ribosome-associated translation inhibitor RaiA [Patescibacteria group bacterium]|nr:ribosome-associated translation inhibitor RaiA [Patescibacteria group bacterium]